MERTLSYTAAAVVTCSLVNDKLSVCKPCGAYRTSLFYLAYLTAPAFTVIVARNSGAYYTNIVKVRLYAVVWTAAKCNFKFVRKSYAAVAMEKHFVGCFT